MLQDTHKLVDLEISSFIQLDQIVIERLKSFLQNFF